MENKLKSNTSNKSIDQIVDELKKIELDERKLEEDALERLSFIARHRHYQKFNCKSLFDFCVQELGYSNGKASRRSMAVRCLDSLSDQKRENILSEIQTGALTLTHLVQAQSVFRQEKPSLMKKEEILDKLKNKSTRESEKILVSEFGSRVAIKESIRQVSETESKVSLILDQETMELLERFKNLSAHENPYGSNALALKLALKTALKVKDPMQKEIKKGALKNSQDTNAVPDSVPAPEMATPNVSNIVSKSRTARGNLRALVWKKYQGKCSSIDSRSGQRCSSQYMLEVDHVRPVSLGGITELSNLRLLCRDHHRIRA